MKYDLVESTARGAAGAVIRVLLVAWFKVFWDACKARELMRSWPTNTTVDCNWTYSCQELLSIWPPSRCNKSADLGEDMKAAVSWWPGQHRESVGLGPEGEEVRGRRSGLPAATGSSSRDLHVSDRLTGGKCKCSSWASLELVSSVFFLARVWLFFFLLWNNTCRSVLLCLLFKCKTYCAAFAYACVFNKQHLTPRMGCVSSVWTKLLLKPFQSVSWREMKNEQSWCNASVNKQLGFYLIYSFLCQKTFMTCFFQWSGRSDSMSVYRLQNIQKIK